jgi:hypothetical protein
MSLSAATADGAAAIRHQFAYVVGKPVVRPLALHVRRSTGDAFGLRAPGELAATAGVEGIHAASGASARRRSVSPSAEPNEERRKFHAGATIGGAGGGGLAARRYLRPVDTAERVDLILAGVPSGDVFKWRTERSLVASAAKQQAIINAVAEGARRRSAATNEASFNDHHVVNGATHGGPPRPHSALVARSRVEQLRRGVEDEADAAAWDPDYEDRVALAERRRLEILLAPGAGPVTRDGLRRAKAALDWERRRAAHDAAAAGNATGRQHSATSAVEPGAKSPATGHSAASGRGGFSGSGIVGLDPDAVSAPRPVHLRGVMPGYMASTRPRAAVLVARRERETQRAAVLAEEKEVVRAEWQRLKQRAVRPTSSLR